MVSFKIKRFSSLIPIAGAFGSALLAHYADKKSDKYLPPMNEEQAKEFEEKFGLDLKKDVIPTQVYLKHFEGIDENKPQKGYSPEEWKKFYNTKVNSSFHVHPKEKVIPDKIGSPLLINNETGDVGYQPAMVAHEAGHKHYYEDNQKHTFGGIAHRIYDPAKKFPLCIGPLVGAASGIHEALREHQGKKRSNLLRHATWAIPTLRTLPILISEAAASKYGLSKLSDMKSLSESEKREAKKHLAACFGTYLGNAGAEVAVSELCRINGKRATELLLKKFKKKDGRKEK